MSGARRRLLCLALCASLLAAWPAQAGTAQAETAQAETTQADTAPWRALDRALRDAFRQDDTLGAAVAIAEQGQLLHTYAMGTAVTNGDVPVTDDTLFRTASATKLVTAMGAMRLVETGVLALDADIGDYLGYPVRNPRYPDEPITLRQLMAHTAGIQHNADYALKDTHYRKPLREMLCDGSHVRENFSSARPGERYAYSNFGAGIVGSIIEAVTGQSLEAYMAEAIFVPLGVNAAYQPAAAAEGTRFAINYRRSNDSRAHDPLALLAQEPVPAAADPEWHYDWAAGLLHIDAAGLARVLSVLACDGRVDGVRILSPEAARLMRQPQGGIGSCWGETPHGLGVERHASWVQNRTLYGHQGTLYSLLCDAFCDPMDGTVVVMLTNTTALARDERGLPVLATTVLEACFDALAAR